MRAIASARGRLIVLGEYGVLRGAPALVVAVERRVQVTAELASRDAYPRAPVVEAVLEDRATKDQEEYTIGDRSLKRTPMKDLLVLRDTYRLDVKAEEAANVAAAGLGARTVGGRVNRV